MEKIKVALDAGGDQPLDRLRCIRNEHGASFDPAHFNVIFAGLTRGFPFSPDEALARRDFAAELLPALLNCSTPRRSWENTSIMQALSLLGVRDQRTFQVLSRQALNESSQFDSAEIVQCAKAVSHFRQSRTPSLPLITAICNQAYSIRSTFDGDSAVALLAALAERLVVDPRLFRHTCEKIVAGDWTPSGMSLGKLAVAISIVQFENARISRHIKNFATREITRFLQNDDNEEQDVLALVRCIRAQETCQNLLSRDDVKPIHDKLASSLMQYSRTVRNRILFEFVPVCQNIGLKLSPKLNRAVINFQEDMVRSESGAPPSIFQQQVADVLRSAGIAFEEDSRVGVFKTDFLIRDTTTYRPACLEADSEDRTTIYCIDGTPYSHTRSGRDVFRDQVLQKLLYSSKRVSWSEWDSSPRSEREGLLRKLLPQLKWRPPS